MPRIRSKLGDEKSGHALEHVKEKLVSQLTEQRRAVDFDTFDIQVQQLLSMLEDGQILVAPAYQRQFRWDEHRCSQLVESLMLGIPVPSLFMATNTDSKWETVDGVQRLCSIVKFAGSKQLREKLSVGDALKLQELSTLDNFDGFSYEKLPIQVQLHFKTRPLKVITLNDKSDMKVRYDLFERLNTGGIALSHQEIRGCIYQGAFSEKLEELSKLPDFKTVVKLKVGQQKDGTAEECVLRFLAFFERYKSFDHSVKDFLNEYMSDTTKKRSFGNEEAVFRNTFRELARIFPDGIKRHSGRSTTPMNLFEGVAVGAALALQKAPTLDATGLDEWLASPILRNFTTGATNSRPQVTGRIHFCRDRFLGRP